MQGVGWLTTEELVWDADGRLTTHAPSTYKIPACSDRPIDLRIALWDEGRNAEETIYRSKAVGEPPLMLGISVLHGALRCGGQRRRPPHLSRARRAGHAREGADDAGCAARTAWRIRRAGGSVTELLARVGPARSAAAGGGASGRR